MHELIDQINDDAILQAVYTLLSKQRVAEVDFWDRLTEAQRNDIEAGLADLEAGRKNNFQEVLTEYKTR